MSPGWQMVMATPAVALASGVGHAMFWLIGHLFLGMSDPWLGWWQGDGLFGLAIGVVFGFFAYLLLVLNAEKVADRTMFARVLHAALLGCCVGIIPLVIVVAVRLVSVAGGLEPRAGVLEEAKLFGAMFGLVIYPVISGIIWAVLSWQSAGTVPVREIGDG